MRWFTSDLHLNHESVLGYNRRPFDTLDDMHAGLADRWNACIRPDDDVWILGDLTLKNPCPDGVPDQWLAAYLKDLAGHKHLILGNHDRGWSQGTVKEGWTERYMALGVDSVAISHQAIILGQPVWLHHLPNNPGAVEMAQENVPVEAWSTSVPERMDDTTWRLNGHVHASWRQRGRQVNVGIDAWGGWPVGEEELALLMDAGPAEREILIWQSRAGMSW